MPTPEQDAREALRKITEIAGAIINHGDRIYPKPGHVAAATASSTDEWPESEDVDLYVTESQLAFG